MPKSVKHTVSVRRMVFEVCSNEKGIRIDDESVNSSYITSDLQKKISKWKMKEKEFFHFQSRFLIFENEADNLQYSLVD